MKVCAQIWRKDTSVSANLAMKEKPVNQVCVKARHIYLCSIDHMRAVVYYETKYGVNGKWNLPKEKALPEP